MKSRSDTPHHNPTSDADDSSARDVRWITVWSTIFILAFLCIAGCRWMLKVNADNQLKVFGDAGYPTTLEQLDAWYSLPDDARNAADLYLKAFDAHDPCEVPFPADSPAAHPPREGDESNARTNAGKFSFLPPPHSSSGKPQRENICDFVPIISAHTTTELGAEKQPPPETVMAATDIYLERNRQAIDLLHEAATLEHCRYPVDLTLGPRALLPYLSLRLVKSEEEPAVLVYSLGPDRTDDGGQGQTTGASSKGDIVFTFPIPPTDAPSPGAGIETP